MINAFKRLRRSKGTKDIYFTIEREEPLEKKDLSKTNENNFENKTEYVYVETNDEPPKVIEKEVKETIVIEKPIENTGRFNNDKVKNVGPRQTPRQAAAVFKIIAAERPRPKEKGERRRIYNEWIVIFAPQKGKKTAPLPYALCAGRQNK